MDTTIEMTMLQLIAFLLAAFGAGALVPEEQLGKFRLPAAGICLVMLGLFLTR